jgi:hypothetical protein
MNAIHVDANNANAIETLAPALKIAILIARFLKEFFPACQQGFERANQSFTQAPFDL